MAAKKVLINIEEELLQMIDKLVLAEIYPNRSQAIQEAIKEKLARLANDL
ncbi:MAG: ribbon-helix-helix domain-containing protein [Mariprofundus sp.]|nr:ribbon-helix-helix domain-containing protein [Mariprofundus sp.]